MGAGDMRHAVAIERKEEVSDGAGGFDVIWTPVLSYQVPAKIVPVKTRSSSVERESGGSITSSPMFEITVRHDPDLAAFLLAPAGYRLRDMDTAAIYGVNFALDQTGMGRFITITATLGEPT